MAGILSQFHALPEELRPLLTWAMADLAVHVTAFRFPPFQAVAVRPDALDEFLLFDPLVGEVALTLEVPCYRLRRRASFSTGIQAPCSLASGDCRRRDWTNLVSRAATRTPVRWTYGERSPANCGVSRRQVQSP